MPRDYVGCTVNMKTRWSRHKSDIRHNREDACGLTKYFALHHQGDMEQAITNLQVILLENLEVFSDQALLQLEKDWIINLGTWGPTGLNTRNQLLTNQRRNWGS